MHVSLDTLDRAVQFADSLADLDQPDRAADFILPGLTGLIGCDIATYQEMSPEPNRLGHYTEYPAASLLGRLQALGFERLTIMVDESLMFVAHRPAAKISEPADGPRPAAG